MDTAISWCTHFVTICRCCLIEKIKNYPKWHILVFLTQFSLSLGTHINRICCLISLCVLCLCQVPYRIRLQKYRWFIAFNFMRTSFCLTFFSIFKHWYHRFLPILTASPLPRIKKLLTQLLPITHCCSLHHWKCLHGY